MLASQRWKHLVFRPRVFILASIRVMAVPGLLATCWVPAVADEISYSAWRESLRMRSGAVREATPTDVGLPYESRDASDTRSAPEPISSDSGDDSAFGRKLPSDAEHFAQPDLYPTGTGPVHFAIGSFDGRDGTDLVTANRHGRSFTVLLGARDGSMAPHSTVPLPGHPNHVAVGDLDDDGRDDLAFAMPYLDQILLYFGRGDGTFEAGGALGTGREPMAVVLADLDRDGWLDLVTSDFEDGTVSLIQNQGSRSFASREAFEVGGRPWDVAVADFDGDGFTDVVTANGWGEHAALLLGRPGFRLAPRIVISVPGPIQKVAGADMDGDGRTDLIGSGAREAFQLRNEGGNVFTTIRLWPLRQGSWTHSISVADLDGDSRLDLLLATSSEECEVSPQPWRTTWLALALSGSPGGLGRLVTYYVHGVSFHAAFVPRRSHGADLLVSIYGCYSSAYTELTGSAIAVVAPGQDGWLEAARHEALAPEDTGWPFLEGPAAVGGQPGTSLRFAYGFRDTVWIGAFQSFGALAPPVPITRGTQRSVTDLNRDGLDDLLVHRSDSLAIFFGHKSGAFTAGPVMFDDGFLGAADLAGRGWRDLLFVTASSQLLRRRNLKDGTFGDLVELSPPRVGTRYWGDMAIGDLDGDRREDIVLTTMDAERSTDSLIIFRGLVDRVSTPMAVHLPYNPHEGWDRPIPRRAVLADLNGDRRKDVVVLVETDGAHLQAALNVADGLFTALPSLFVNFEIVGLAADDLDGDGRDEIVVTKPRESASSVYVHELGSNGSLVRTAEIRMALWPHSFGILDANGDGVPDVAAMGRARYDFGMDLFIGSGRKPRGHMKDKMDAEADEVGKVAGIVGSEPDLPEFGVHHARAVKGGARVSFSLSSAQPATLELYDVTGRHVASEDVGMLGPGLHEVNLVKGGGTANGIYWARLRQGPRVSVKRFLILR